MSFRSLARASVNWSLRPFGLRLGRYRSAGPGYEHYLRRALNGVDRPVVLDIGANTGQSALQCLQVCPNAEVHSFEPSPAAFAHMMASVHSPGFHGHNVAIGEFDGVVPFHQFEHSQTASCLEPAAGVSRFAPYLVQRAGTVDVPIRRLDSLLPTLDLPGPVDYMKIDVQGYEDRVLRGAQEALRRTRYIMVEANFNRVYEGSCLVDTLCHLLYVQGFRLAGTVGYLVGEDVDELLSADFLFERVAPVTLP